MGSKQLTFDDLDGPNMPGRSRSSSSSRSSSRMTMQEKYDAIVVEMKRRYGFRVNKWRKSMTGCAWAVVYHDGSTSYLIEAPYPKGPMSAAIFLHEVGHHALGLQSVSPRCLEEYHVWMWALATMEEYGLNITDGVKRRVAESVRYAVAKAVRRGLKRLPAELVPFAPKGWVQSP